MIPTAGRYLRRLAAPGIGQRRNEAVRAFIGPSLHQEARVQVVSRPANAAWLVIAARFGPRHRPIRCRGSSRHRTLAVPLARGRCGGRSLPRQRAPVRVGPVISRLAKGPTGGTREGGASTTPRRRLESSYDLKSATGTSRAVACSWQAASRCRPLDSVQRTRENVQMRKAAAFRVRR